MKPISGKEFSKILEKNGWVLSRINGSHHIYTKLGRIERISVPIHSNVDLKIGLLKNLLKISGINNPDSE
jgi:predicted RNA binding protein YcfA (HicA-like mRNA interferase family)